MAFLVEQRANRTARNTLRRAEKDNWRDAQAPFFDLG